MEYLAGIQGHLQIKVYRWNCNQFHSGDNDEARMTNVEGNPNDEARTVWQHTSLFIF